jgi:hypothetical protein
MQAGIQMKGDRLLPAFKVMKQVAEVLKKVSDRQIRIEGIRTMCRSGRD